MIILMDVIFLQAKNLHSIDIYIVYKYICFLKKIIFSYSFHYLMNIVIEYKILI